MALQHRGTQFWRYRDLDETLAAFLLAQAAPDPLNVRPCAIAKVTHRAARGTVRRSAWRGWTSVFAGDSGGISDLVERDPVLEPGPVGSEAVYRE